MKALYGKHNNRSRNSSTFHKLDGTPVRAIMKRETARELATVDTQSRETPAYDADDGALSAGFIEDLRIHAARNLPKGKVVRSASVFPLD